MAPQKSESKVSRLLQAFLQALKSKGIHVGSKPRYMGNWRYTDKNISYVLSVAGDVAWMDLLWSYFPGNESVSVTSWEFGHGGEGEGFRIGEGYASLSIDDPATVAGMKSLAKYAAEAVRYLDEINEGRENPGRKNPGRTRRNAGSRANPRAGARPGNLYRYAIDHIDEIKREIEAVKRLSTTGASHAAAIVAHRFYRLTDKEWNGPNGGEYFAAIYALIMYKNLY